MSRLLECSIADDVLFGRSEAMQEIRRQVDNIADCGLPVLIEGESGTGKEVLALAIHARSSRSNRGVVKVKCSEASLPELDRVLSGDDCMHAGTIVFDEISELPVSTQAKIVALLEDPRFCGAGDEGIQVLCTTKTTLRPKVDAGAFRDDLYYRINVVNLRLPALRERRVDIPMLAMYFYKAYAAKYQRDPGPFSQHLMDALSRAPWPGNIRQLENAVKRYITLGSVETMVADLQPAAGTTEVAGASRDLSFKALKRNAIRDCEYKVILDSLNRNHWNRHTTALELNISYRSLLYMMQQLGLPRKRSSSVAAGSSAESSSLS